MIEIFVILGILFVIAVAFAIVLTVHYNKHQKKKKQFQKKADYAFKNINNHESGKRIINYIIRKMKTADGSYIIKIATDPEFLLRDFNSKYILDTGGESATITVKGLTTNNVQTHKFVVEKAKDGKYTKQQRPVFDVPVSEQDLQEDLEFTIVTHWNFGGAKVEDRLVFIYEKI